MALEDGRITITITDDRGSGGSSDNTGVAKGKGTRTGGFNAVNPLNQENDEFANFAKHEAIHFLKQETMTMINHYIGTIGSRTGDYVTQQNTQAGFSLGMKFVSIGMMAKIGFKAGGPFGAAIGTGIGVIFTGTNFLLERANQERQVRMQNRDIEMLRQRAGLDSLNNGSR